MGGNGLVIATVPLRGYDDRSIGPARGGDVAIRYTTELRVAVILEPVPLYLLAFAEAGNVYLDLQHADPFNLDRSVGVGARIMIQPIGLIGVDMGWVLTEKQLTAKSRMAVPFPIWQRILITIYFHKR